jgi:CotH kinase protein
MSMGSKRALGSGNVLSMSRHSERAALQRWAWALAVSAVLGVACSGADDESSESVPSVPATDTGDEALTETELQPEADASPRADEPVDDSSADESTTEEIALAENDTQESAANEPEADDAPRARWETGDSDYLFDQNLLHTYELTIPDEHLAILDGDPAAEEYVEGSLTFEGETLDSVGIRYKGSIGSFLGCTSGPNPIRPSGEKTCSKLSMKIKINWNEKVEFYGLRRVQLHAMNLDSTLMHDRLGYWMFEQAGVAGPRSTHARLLINGEFAGLFAMTEQIDGRLVRDRFDDGTGNVYKEVWPFDDTGTVQPDDVFVDGLETNEDDDPDADIIRAFAAEILDSGAVTDPDAARDVIDRWTDLDAFIAYAVVDRAIAHEDGPFHWYCLDGPCEPHNFYWYEDPTERKLHLIPWDLDNAFDNLVDDVNPITSIADEWGETRSDCQPFAYGPLNLLQRSAGCDPLVAAWSSLSDDYERVRRELFTGPLSLDLLLDRLDVWAEQIEPVVVEQQTELDDALTVDNWKAALATLAENLTIALEN